MRALMISLLFSTMLGCNTWSAECQEQRAACLRRCDAVDSAEVRREDGDPHRLPRSQCEASCGCGPGTTPAPPSGPPTPTG